MRDALIIIAGAALCSVGAYGFLHDLSNWGWWLIIGAIVMGSTQVEKITE